MTDKIKIIIAHIDSYLEKTGQFQITANEASRYLDKLGILNYGTKGQPLRKLLRAGYIPNAIQPNGKNTQWYIRHSKSKPGINPVVAPKVVREQTAVVNNTTSHSIGLAPVESDTAEYLILGTLPGAESLKKRQYYAFSNNRFWSIMSAILNEPKLTGCSYQERVSIIKKHNVALWDVLKVAERDGSLDASIKNPVFNDILGFLNAHPSVRIIGFNGKEAYKYFLKYVDNVSIPSRISIIELLSTSSRNNRFSMDDMIKNWSQLFK